MVEDETTIVPRSTASAGLAGDRVKSGQPAPAALFEHGGRGKREPVSASDGSEPFGGQK
jgi:hypothetical protein